MSRLDLPMDARYTRADRSSGGIACGACGFTFPRRDVEGSVARVLACPKCGGFVRLGLN